MTLKREKVGYHDTNIVGDFASATKIRQHLKSEEEIKNIVTKESYNILNHYSNLTYKGYALEYRDFS